MNDSQQLKRSEKLISELSKAVGEENVESVIYNIRASKEPQFYTFSLLSNGISSLYKKTWKTLHDCGVDLPVDFKIPVKKNWLKVSNSQPLNVYQENVFSFRKKNSERKASFFDDALTKIHDFLSIEINPYQPIDLLKLFTLDKTLIPQDLFTKFINENDWHAGLKPLDVFEAIEDPATKGDLSTVVNCSYTKVTYAKGYPCCSGMKSSEIMLHNYDWVSCERDTEDDAKSKTAIIPQVTDLMENIEDENNELDVLISQNKNVYRMLLYGGPLSSSFSPIVAEELNRIYPEKGGLIVELLHSEPDSVYPIVLKRLRERCQELYLRKVSNSGGWCKQLETSLPTRRTIYKKDFVKKIKPKEINFISGDKIDYPIEKVYLLLHFYQNAKINMHVDPKNPNLEEEMNESIRKVINILKNTQIRDVKVTFAQAICIYCAAFFLKEVFSVDVIDNLESPSVQTAVSIGITDAEEHGYQKLLTIIGDSINKKKAKKNGTLPIVNCILEISGKMFNIDFEKASLLIQLGQLFFKVLRNYALEDENEATFITCKLENGYISLLNGDEIVQIGL